MMADRHGEVPYTFVRRASAHASILRASIYAMMLIYFLLKLTDYKFVFKYLDIDTSTEDR